MKSFHDIVERLRAEYLEMPGLHLTAQQIQRLCGIERTVCQSVLDALVKAKFLAAKPDGHYSRLTEGQVYRRAPAKADLRTNSPINESVLSSRQPERRRVGRSEADMQHQRERFEHQSNDEHQPAAHQERGSADVRVKPMISGPAMGKLAS
jgi:hypothetical protein